MPPALKSMCSSNVLENLRSRSQIQVICVIETQSNAKCLDLLCCEAFDGGLGGNRHKGRKYSSAV